MSTGTTTRRGPSLSPLPAHGTYARSVGRPGQGVAGCKCRACRDAGNRYSKRRRVFNATGRELRVPAEPVAAKIRQLLDAGMGWTRITAAGETSSCTLHKILNGQPAVRRDVAARILAIAYVPAPGRLVDATGMRRRVQTLLAIGHTITAIADAAPIDKSVIIHVLAGRKTSIHGRTADLVSDLYEAWKDTPGTSTRSRKRATTEGWPGPEYWDPDTFDDPDFVPATGKTLRYVALAEDCLELEAHGYSRQDAADRLGITKDRAQQSIHLWRKAQAAAAQADDEAAA